MFDSTNEEGRVTKKRKTSVEMTESYEIGEEEIIFQEILPRLPVKSLFRFNVVCKTWFNFLTKDPVFALQHSKKGPNTTTFFSFKSEIFYSSDDHFTWSKPSFMNSIQDLVRGSTRGLIYGECSNLTQIFICNPVTKHPVYVPNPYRLHVMGLAWDPHNPSFGFTIVSPVVLREEIDGTEVLQFHVYSSKTGEWRVSENASGFRVPCNRIMNRRFQAAYPGNKRVYFSLMDHVMWFDVEKDVAGLIRCPDHRNFVPPDWNLFRTEIGVCDGEVSYTRMTKQGDVEIWLLSDKDSKVEWVKKHTVGLLRIVEENWNTMFEMICKDMMNVKERMNASKVLAHVVPLPFSGGEEVWFFMITLNNVKKAFSFNLRTQELKLINKDGTIKDPLMPFVPTLLPCPT